jgi:hypothetical protein
MNNRIKEIAQEAGYNAIFDTDCKARERLQKYTELLIKECLDTVAYTVVRYDEIDTIHKIRDRIESHFRME